MYTHWALHELFKIQRYVDDDDRNDVWYIIYGRPPVSFWFEIKPQLDADCRAKIKLFHDVKGLRRLETTTVGNVQLGRNCEENFLLGFLYICLLYTSGLRALIVREYTHWINNTESRS